MASEGLKKLKMFNIFGGLPRLKFKNNLGDFKTLKTRKKNTKKFKTPVKIVYVFAFMYLHVHVILCKTISYYM